MVEGLGRFKDHFKEYTDHYILIGGSACDWQLEQKGVNFRATKDLDIILVAEALSADFVRRFWQFIRQGGYSIAQIGEQKKFYRFIQPKEAEYPKMLELFSRKPDLIAESPDMHLTPIPMEEEVSSLSAILLDDAPYYFTVSHSTVTDDLHHATESALICLKAKAFLNNATRKLAGHFVRKEDIDKHKRDVIRLTAALTPGTLIEAPSSIKTDLQRYSAIIREENPDVRQILQADVGIEQILESLEQTFGLTAIMGPNPSF